MRSMFPFLHRRVVLGIAIQFRNEVLRMLLLRSSQNERLQEKYTLFYKKIELKSTYE